MLRFGRVAVFTVAGVLTAGALTAGVLTTTARAGSVLTMTARTASTAVPGDRCQVSSSARPTCFIGESVRLPLAAWISVTSQPPRSVNVAWTISCAQGNTTATKSGTIAKQAPFTARLTLPRTNAAQCSVSASVTAGGQGSMVASFSYTLAQQVLIDIPQGADFAGNPIYALRCVTDPGNSPKLRAPAQITGCGTLYSQAWTFSKGELVHGRYCLTDKGNGGAHSKIILYTCSHAADQVWKYRTAGPNAPEGEFVLKSHGGGLCLEDPRISVKSGTQLIVDKCNNNNGQKWYMN